MKNIRLLIVFAFLTLFVNLDLVAQDKLSLFTSSGYTSHLNRTGVNFELGLDYELFKRLDIAMAYRYNSMNRHVDNRVEISNISLYLSWIILNRNSHRLLVGPGIQYGKYLRNSDYLGFEKEYTYTWINPIRVQYDFTFSTNIRIGGIVSLYGDDGDGTTYFGFLVGYKF